MVYKKNLNIKQGHLVGLAFFCLGTFNYSFPMSVTDNFQIATWNVLHPKAYEVAIKARKSPSSIPNPRLSESARDVLMSAAVSELVSSADIICFQEFNYDKNGNDRKLFLKKDFSHEFIVPESYETKSDFGIAYAMGVATAFDRTKFDLIGEPIWRLIKEGDIRHNLLFIKLRSKATGSIFGIFNVHLPFTLKEFDAVDKLGEVISQILLEKEKFITVDVNYFLICGDFNIDSYNNLAKVKEIKDKPLVQGFSLSEIFEGDKDRMTAIGSDGATRKRFDYIFYFPGSILNDLILAEAYTYPELPTDIAKLVRHDQGSTKYEFSSDHAVVFAHFVGTREEKEKSPAVPKVVAPKLPLVVPQVPEGPEEPQVPEEPSAQEVAARKEALLKKVSMEKKQSKSLETKEKLARELSKVAVEVAPEPPKPLVIPLPEPPKQQQRPSQSKKSGKRRRKKGKGKRTTPKKLKKKKKSKKGKRGKGRRRSYAKNKKSKH